MSDTTTIAPPSPAPQPAPVQNEVPINQEPATSQNPVTNAPPEKPAEDRATRRRADLQKAFERANDPEAAKAAKEAKDASRPPPKPAEAKSGHNQPPEETPQEQPRDRGRFAPRQAVPPDATNQAKNVASEEQKATGHRSYKQLPPHAPFAAPPPRMDDAAKAEWYATPEPVRGSIHRMHNEFQSAYERYRGDAEAFQPVRGYHEMARSHGTTLDRALHNYVTMEQKLRQDVVGGLDIIVNNLNLRTPDGQKLSLQDIAYHVLSQSPDQHKLLQQQNAQQAAAQQIGSLHQEVEGLKNHLQQMYAAQQFNQIRGGVDHYAVKHPRFDELGDLIKNEIDLGFDLDTAYRRAELLRPATQAAQTGTASAQTRPTDKSIYGAPAGPSNGTGRKSEKPVGRREAIQKAIRAANGAL